MGPSSPALREERHASVRGGRGVPLLSLCVTLKSVEMVKHMCETAQKIVPIFLILL